MNDKEIAQIIYTNSSVPIIKNPVLRAALQEPRNMAQARLEDDVVPGPLKDEIAGNFDPKQETYEEYLQRINLQRPFNMAEGGQLVAPSVDGSRPGYATSKKKSNKFKYKITNQHGTVYSDIKPKSSAKEVGSGKFSIADRNRVTRIKYPEYNSYSELLKKEPAKAKNVMATLQYSSVSGSKIKKKTHLTRLTKIQENKILAEFPDAVFFDGQKFGFNTKTDQTKFVQVKKFIDRGYKPRFKQLPEKIQNELKEKFSHFKDWDFKKFKYGIPDSATNIDNRRLMMKVKTFINDPKPWKLGFSTQAKGGWMVQQMYRAWEHGNTDYDPKYNKNGKVIGMYEKGKLYYANENVAEIDGAKKFKLINSHPEFNKIQKFVDVAAEAKLPLKKLGGYKNTKSLLALFPEGYENIKFSDLTNYLYKEAGADATRNAIEKHHLKNLSDMGAPIDSKNLQLLRQDLNTLGNTITEQIKKGDFSRVADLEKAGVKITVDGKTYGKGFQDPRRQLNLLIGQTAQKIKSLTTKDKNILLKEIQAFCGYGKSTGGRIGFKTGSCPPEVAMRNFLMATNDVHTGKITGEAAEQIKKQTKNVVAKAGSRSALTKLLGPAGIGLDVIYEVASIGTDIYGGTPWREALQDNWITGAFMPGTSLKEFHKNFFKKNPEAKPYGSGLELEEAYAKKLKKIERLKANTTARGRAEAKGQLPGLERDLKGILASYNALGNVMEEGSPEYENYMAAKTEYLDTRKAKAPSTKAKLEMELNRPTSDRAVSYETLKPLKIDLNLPGNYTTFKPVVPSSEEVDEVYTKAGYDLSPQDIDYVQKMEKWSQLFNDPKNRGMGIRGTQDWKGAGGGIVGIRRPHAIPPESGPTPQGLPSMLNRVKRI